APRAHVPHFQPPRYSAPRVTHPTPRPPSPPKMSHQAARMSGHARTAGKAPSVPKATAPGLHASRGSSSTVRHGANPGALAPLTASTNRAPGRVRRNPRYYGYGVGYARRGYYGSSMSRLDRMAVSRLRSEYVNLARVPENYQGHRTRSMQHISAAIRQ